MRPDDRDHPEDLTAPPFVRRRFNVFEGIRSHRTGYVPLSDDLSSDARTDRPRRELGLNMLNPKDAHGRQKHGGAVTMNGRLGGPFHPAGDSCGVPKPATRAQSKGDVPQGQGSQGVQVAGDIGAYATAGGHRGMSRRLPDRPVVPAWLKGWGTASATAAWGARYGLHVTSFHTLRLPVYWGRLAARSPLGLYRIGLAVARWALDADGRPVRQSLAAAASRRNCDKADVTAYVRLEEQRRRLVRTRLAVLGITVAISAMVGDGLISVASTWQLLIAAVAILAGLGALGHDLSRPIISRASDTDGSPRLTTDLILSALGSLGIGELNKSLRVSGEQALRFTSPITRDGAGWRADIDLPPGVTVAEVFERRDRLASALRRPLSSVWPEVNHDAHTGRLVLWVADNPLTKAKPVPWPLAEHGMVNLFEPFPLGVDPRGRQITTTLMFVSAVVGAQPRMGKSFTVRLLLLAAALDVRAELHVYDLKGGADFLPLEPVTYRFRIGDEPDDIAYLLADLRDIAADMTARYKTLRRLDREICPEGKVTDHLASQKCLGLHPVVAVLDECQRAFEHPEHGKEITAITEDLARRGPAAGIIVIASTQRPDAKSLPRGIASNAAWRFCLKVAGQVENDMTLGTSSYKNGVRATMFSRSDKGVGYLAGEGDDPVIVRTAYLDAKAAETIASRARVARLASGRITGHAAAVDLAPGTDESSTS